MLQPFLNADLVEAGCDEAGRGCLAGPVFAAAVILPKAFRHPLLNDSKLLDEATRLAARALIEQHALAWAVASASPQEIDRINILNASFLAMHRAIEKLSPAPESLLIDGNRFKPYRNLPFQCVVKGDGKLMPIAAASILAKTHRDTYMRRLAGDFPTTAGTATRAIRPFPTGKPSSNMAPASTIAARSACWAIRCRASCFRPLLRFDQKGVVLTLVADRCLGAVARIHLYIIAQREDHVFDAVDQGLEIAAR